MKIINKIINFFTKINVPDNEHVVEYICLECEHKPFTRYGWYVKHMADKHGVEAD